MDTKDMKITIGHLYPDLLNLYGDRGNIACLMKRCIWRGIEAETIEFNTGDQIDFSKLDIVLFGGGSDGELAMVCKSLLEIQSEFKDYVEDGGVVIAVCGGYQLLGKYYKTDAGMIEGLNLVDIYTEQEEGRLIDNIVLDSDLVDMPVVVNGQITEAKTDAYSFYARKGDTVVIDVWGRMQLPYISDAVPGWFQPVVRVTDSRGKEVAYCDDFFHRPDPHLSFKVPESGVYRAEIFDAIYRSREDFVYRMSISTRPFVEYVFPLGGASGESPEFEVGGANLENNKIKIDIPEGAGEFSPDFGWDSIPELKIK